MKGIVLIKKLLKSVGQVSALLPIAWRLPARQTSIVLSLQADIKLAYNRYFVKRWLSTGRFTIISWVYRRCGAALRTVFDCFSIIDSLAIRADSIASCVPSQCHIYHILMWHHSIT
jgi:hypothetical protein